MKKFNLTIDAEFENFIPPLSKEEFSQLEENILRDGIQDPLKIWEGTLIDGHNRYKIAQKHNLPFQTVEMEFANRNAVKEWLILNQVGRRNISAYARACLALKLKPLFTTQAKQNSLSNLKQKEKTECPKLGTRTDDKIAKMAGVGRETLRKVEKIQQLSNTINLADIIQELERGTISINLAYEAASIRQEKLSNEVEELKKLFADLHKSADLLRTLYEDLKRRDIPENQHREISEMKTACETISSFMWKIRGVENA